MNFGENGVKMITQVGNDKVECLVFPNKEESASIDESGEIQSHAGFTNWVYVGKDEKNFFMLGGAVTAQSDGSFSFGLMKPAGFPEPDQEMLDAFQEDIEEAKLVDASELAEILSKL